MTDDKLRAKLAKLKALADAAQGKPEGITALAMFQKLLKKYGVNEDNISAKRDETEVDTIVVFESGRVECWILYLAAMLAPHFRCLASRSRFGNRTRILYDGFVCDLEIAQSAFMAAYRTILRLSDAIISERTGLTTRRARNSYKIGFAFGIDEALKRQESSGELGLAVVVPEAVTEKFEGKKRHSYNVSVNDKYSFDKGFSDGKEHLNKKKLSCG